MVERIENSRFVRLLAIVSNFGIIIAVVAFALDSHARGEERNRFAEEQEEWAYNRQVQAWQLLLTPGQGNTGKRLALEVLASNRERLNGIDLSCERFDGGWDPVELACDLPTDLSRLVAPRSFLFEANLSGSLLDYADLREAFLNDIRLDGADLFLAHFSRAELNRASLVGVDARGAMFDNTELRNADFTSSRLDFAVFDEADITGANFSGATGLETARLVGACADGGRIIDDGNGFVVEIEACFDPGIATFGELLEEDRLTREFTLRQAVSTRENDPSIMDAFQNSWVEETIELPDILGGSSE